MKARFLLTLLWLTSFLVCVFIVESYIHIKSPRGKLYLLPDDRLDCLRPLSVLYSCYLAGILAFWFLRPFNSAVSDQADRTRFIIAVICTVIFNGYILFILSQGFVSSSTNGNILKDVDTAVGMAKYLSFIVAPVNAYYFGMKMKST